MSASTEQRDIRLLLPSIVLHIPPVCWFVVDPASIVPVTVTFSITAGYASSPAWPATVPALVILSPVTDTSLKLTLAKRPRRNEKNPRLPFTAVVMLRLLMV